MINEEKIIELLTKDSFTDKEMKLLSDAANKNPDLRKLIQIVQSLNLTSENEHIDTGTLSDYALYLNGEKANESIVAPVIPRIEDHIKSCSKCREEFEFLNMELNEIDKHLAERIRTINKQTASVSNSVSILSVFNNYKYYYSYAALTVFFVITIISVSFFTTPDYVRISAESANEDFSITRSRSTTHFNNAVMAFEQDDYKTAIKELINDAKFNSNDQTIFYTYYVLGKTHLIKAYNDFFGLFPSYNEDDLTSAIDNFNKVLELNQSGMFQNINMNTYYYLGKSYLLKGEIKSAKEYLQKAIDEKCEYSEEAESLLSSIE